MGLGDSGYLDDMGGFFCRRTITFLAHDHTHMRARPGRRDETESGALWRGTSSGH